MKIPEPLLSPSEIAATIYDSGHVRDRGSAERLEQRILAYGAAKGTEAHTQGLIQAARRAHIALAGIRSGSQRGRPHRPRDRKPSPDRRKDERGLCAWLQGRR
jgi:hypothetical protein